MTGAHGDALQGLICRAAALEAHWCERESDGRPVFETVPIMNMGVQTGNRGRVYTQSKTCRTLREQIMKDGFDKEQANAQGVAVRERQATTQLDGRESIKELTYGSRPKTNYSVECTTTTAPSRMGCSPIATC